MSSGKTYDIAVVGAGPAGICAAATASRLGANVLLIDAGARLGGSVTAAMHRSLCGLDASALTSPLDTLNDGLQREVIGRMLAKAPSAVVPRTFGQASVLEFPAPAWEESLTEICSDSRVNLHRNTRAAAVGRENSRMTSLECAGEVQGKFSINAVIDCTGGGSVLQLIGDDSLQPTDPASTEMLGGFAIRWANLAGEPEMLRLHVPYTLNSAVVDGTLPLAARFAVYYPGPGADEGVLKLAITPDALAPQQVAPFVADAIRVLREQLPPFTSATVIEMSPHALRREGRRMLGRYTITEDDVLTARKHGNGAVRAWWPLEIWDPEKGPSYIYPPAGDPYEIPPDALRSAMIENLFAAGTCISATRAAAASTRAGGICLATGAKAGSLLSANLPFTAQNIPLIPSRRYSGERARVA